MSQDHHIQPLPQHPVPTWEVLQQYLDGSLPEAERRQIEASLGENPLLADALDGLQLVSDPRQMQRSLANIRQQTQRKLQIDIVPRREPLSKRQSRIKPDKTYLTLALAVAASLALLFTSISIFQSLDKPASQMATVPITPDNPYPSQQQPLADATPPPADSELQTEDISPAPPANVPTQSLGGAHLQERAPQVLDTPAQPTPVRAATTRPGEVAPDAGGPLQTADDRTTYHEAEATAELAVVSGAPVPDAELADEGEKRRQRESAKLQFDPAQIPARSEEDVRMGEAALGVAMENLLKEAIAAYNQGDYTRAGYKLEELLVSKPDHLAAQYYMGLTQVKLGKYKEALAYLEPVAAAPHVSGGADAEWAIYETLLAMDRPRQARRQLQTIAAKPGPYQLQAQALLKE
ncbi:MAG: hypothetical protein OHK0039_02620 [Bacteroidia bacterium]